MNRVQQLADAARALVDAISFDDNGAMIAGQFRGGNGGLLSRETIAKADAVRRALADLDAAPDEIHLLDTNGRLFGVLFGCVPVLGRKPEGGA